jgi:hypothetical protein
MPPTMLIPTVLKCLLRNFNKKAITKAANTPPRKLVPKEIGFRLPFTIEPSIVLKTATTTPSNGENMSIASRVEKLASPSLAPGITGRNGVSKKFKTIPRATRIDK